VILKMALEEPRISYEELKNRLSEIPESGKFLREKALLCTIYASLARVGEVVRGRYNNTESIRKKDIRIEKTHVVISLLTEKVGLVRSVPVNKIRETWLVRPILLYSAQFTTEEELFPYTTRWAQKVFQKHFPEYNQHIHLLRKWRATHLLQGKVTGATLPIHVVRRMGGWLDLERLSKVYDLSICEDYKHLI